jgi:hypothetical protein
VILDYAFLPTFIDVLLQVFQQGGIVEYQGCSGFTTLGIPDEDAPVLELDVLALNLDQLSAPAA